MIQSAVPQRTDLYSILLGYARKNESPSILMADFIPFLEKYARRFCAEMPEWARWSEQTGTRVWTDMNRLAEEGLVTINNEEESRVYLCRYYAEIIKEAYVNADKESGAPFPDEIILNITVPREQIKPLDLSRDLPGFLADPQKTALPIIKLAFPEGAGEALILAPMIPQIVLDFSLIKIRNYLLRHGNKEFIQHKLLPQFGGKEDHVRGLLEEVTIRPGNCITGIKEARETAYYFWTYFCHLVKTDLIQKKELLAEELGALQGVCVIETCINYFKTRSEKAREVELAFKNFELELEKPPYCFSRQSIAKFTDNKGVPLLGQYTQDGLDAYIQKRTTEPVTPNEMPDLLFFTTDDGAAWLVKKTRILPLCARFCTEARSAVIKAISRRWKKMLKEFRREPAMDNDRDFERIIIACVEQQVPMLAALLKDPRLYLIHEEIRLGRGIPESSRLFNQKELLPLRTLLLLKRKPLLNDIKLLLPFWYSTPVISGIIAFFVNLRAKKQEESAEDAQEKTAPEDPVKALQENARQTARSIIPPEHSMDSYLEELVSRWGRLVHKKAKENLVDDVNSLIRDKLRRLLRSGKNITVNQNTLDSWANVIISGSHGLQKITDQNALSLYIKLFMIKLLTRS